MSKRHLWPSEGPVFTHHESGEITVDRFTPTCRVTGELLRERDPSVLRYNGEQLSITVANGSATYRKIDEDEWYDEVLFELVEADIVEATADAG